MHAESMRSELVQKWTRQQLPMSDYTLGDIDLSLHCPLDNGRHAIQPMQSLGRLSLLPLETLTDVLL